VTTKGFDQIKAHWIICIFDNNYIILQTIITITTMPGLKQGKFNRKCWCRSGV